MTTAKVIIEQAEELVKAHMAKYDPSHDWAHVNRVRRLAITIARTLHTPPDMLVVELAALFHDLAAKYDTDPLATTLAPFYASIASTTSHANTGPAISASQIDLISRIVPSVSWSTETKLRASGGWTPWHDSCAELHCVQDADRLDAIGAIGVMRCAAFSGVKGRLLLDDDTGEGSAEGHFEEKLLRIRDRMKTPYGREEAERRHGTMVVFLQALAGERARQTS